MSDQLFLFSKLFKLIKKHVVSWFQQHLDGTPKLSVVSNRDTASWFWVEWLSWGVCNQCGCKPLAEVDQQWFCQGYHPALDLTDFLQDGNKPWVPPVIWHSSWKVSPFMDDLHIKNFDVRGWVVPILLSQSPWTPQWLGSSTRPCDRPTPLWSSETFSPRWSSGRHAHLIQQKGSGLIFFTVKPIQCLLIQSQLWCKKMWYFQVMISPWYPHYIPMISPLYPYFTQNILILMGKSLVIWLYCWSYVHCLQGHFIHPSHMILLTAPTYSIIKYPYDISINITNIILWIQYFPDELIIFLQGGAPVR